MRIIKIPDQISDNSYITLETIGTKNGFKHEATLVKRQTKNIKVKINYLNRTWERFKYESVMKKLLKKIGLTEAEQMTILELTR